MRFSSTTATDLLPERKGHTAPILRLRSRLAPTVCLGVLVAFLVQGTLLGRVGLAQETTSENTTATKASSTSEEKNPLAAEQKRIAQKYDHFEQVLLRMAELTATTDPDRAALLRRVVAQSKERLVGPQFRETAERLSEGKLSQAIESQEGLRKDLHALLVLLQSENRQKELEARREQLRRQLKKLNRLIGRQRQLRRQTEQTDRPEDLAKPQAKLADQTGRLSQSMSEAKPPQEGSQEGSQEGDPSQDKKPSGSKSSSSGSGQPGPPQKPQDKTPPADPSKSKDDSTSKATETSKTSETQKTARRRPKTDGVGPRKTRENPGKTNRSKHKRRPSTSSSRPSPNSKQFSNSFAKKNAGDCWKTSKVDSRRCSPRRKRSTRRPVA